jgi:hypothetical protein
MSKIEITVGNATVDVQSVVDVEEPNGTFPHYVPRDLMDATAAALLAINTSQSVAWAHGIYELTKGTQG